jgi:hypothetical protein
MFVDVRKVIINDISLPYSMLLEVTVVISGPLGGFIVNGQVVLVIVYTVDFA